MVRTSPRSRREKRRRRRERAKVRLKTSLTGQKCGRIRRGKRRIRMADGQPFVIWVVFDVKPEVFEKFYQAALDDSTCSVRDEPGCLQFDVLAPTAGGTKLAFYEVYKS